MNIIRFLRNWFYLQLYRFFRRGSLICFAHQPVCCACGNKEEVFVYSDNGWAICPPCCEKKTGHDYERGPWPEGWACKHCGELPSYDWIHDQLDRG